MENQEHNANCSQMEQQKAYQQTNEVVLENSENGIGNVNPTETGSAKIPGRDNDRKIFIGGLSKETTEGDLRTYFSKYGTIDSVNLKIDSHTQRSKGFAFIVFSSVETTTKVIAAGVHVINNKKVDTQLTNSKQGKIFVGGITAELSEEDIKSHFGQFGNVVEIQIPFDKVKNQKKNFCFVIFSSVEVVEEVLKTPKVSIKNVSVDVKKAMSKSNSGPADRNLAQGRMGFVQDFRQNSTLQSYVGQNLAQQNFGSENWNGNQMYGVYGYGQQSYGNAYPVDAVYNNGYEGVNVSAGYGSYGNNTSAPNRNNYAGFTRGAGRGASRGGGRRGMTGANNAGRGNDSTSDRNFRYQPY